MLARTMDASLQTLLADPVGAAGQLLALGLKGAGPLAGAIFGLTLVAGVWLWRRSGRKGRTNVLSRRAFSQAEGQLWSRLASALPDHVVLMSIPVTRFLAVRQDGGLGRNKRKLEALTVDYAVFRPDGTISSVVLLEDAEPTLTRRQVKLRGKLLDRAGVKTVSWTSRPLPAVDVIARQLNPTALSYAAGGSGSAKREIRLGSSMVGADDAVAPDTRLAASHLSAAIRPA